MSATKRFKNMSELPQKFKIWTHSKMAPHEYEVAPGEECEIPSGYAGNFIKRRAPGLVALDKMDEYLAAKEAEEKGKKARKSLGKGKGKKADEPKEDEGQKAEGSEPAEGEESKGLFDGLGKDK